MPKSKAARKFSRNKTKADAHKFSTDKLKKLRNKVRGLDAEIVALEATSHMLASGLQELLVQSEKLSEDVIQRYVEPLLKFGEDDGDAPKQLEQAVALAMMFAARKTIWQTSENRGLPKDTARASFKFFTELINKLCSEAEDKDAEEKEKQTQPVSDE